MSITVSEIAEATGAELDGSGEPVITRIATPKDADEHSLVFVRDESHLKGVAASAAGALLVDKSQNLGPTKVPVLRVDNVDLALNTVLERLAPPSPPRSPGVHPTSVVDPSAQIGAGVYIGPFCVIGANAKIGDGSVLMAQIFIGDNVTIGRGCMLHPGVRFLERCSCGDGCTFFGNVVIGADGFGYIPAPDGRGLLKVVHIGTVEIGHAVDIGANACVDRAKFGVTRVGDGTKIDNLAQIGHNVQIGRACVICGQAGMAGSSAIGDGVMLGGQSGVADGCTIGPMVKMGAQSGVMASVPGPGEYIGTPARRARESAAGMALVHKLPSIKARVGAIEKALDQAGIDRKKKST